MKTKILFCIILILLLQIPIFVLAAEVGDVTVKGFELDKLLNLGSALLATSLFVLTILAYNRKRSQRLIYVIIAFLLFAVKGFISSIAIFLGDIGWIDAFANFIDFIILLSFFFGILKK